MRRTAKGPPLSLVTASLVLFLGSVLGESDVVRVRSRYNQGYNQPQVVTSSILRWVSVEPGQPIPENSVIGALSKLTEEQAEDKKPLREKAYICRLKQEGMWVSGQVRPAEDNMCVASMHGQLYRKESYEVLENAEDGARLSWVRWDKFSAVSPGAVTGDDTNYIARRTAPESDRYTHQLGRMEQDGLGKITVIAGNSVADFEDGEILVETEALGYELSNVKFNRWRKRISQNLLELGNGRLTNEDQEGETSRVDTVISYKYNYSMSWGHGHSIITGLPVSVTLVNGTKMDDFKWGIDTAVVQQNLYNVEAWLLPGTGVNVTLVGNYTESNLPFTASLTAIYQDGERRTRNISGNRREVAMWGVRPEFGPVYFLGNGSFVPTTTTTTTSTTTTKATTTTSSTTEAPAPIPPSPIEKPISNATKKGAMEDAQSKGENSVMQNDEGASVRASTDGSSSLHPSLIPLSLAVGFLTLYRIT